MASRQHDQPLAKMKSLKGFLLGGGQLFGSMWSEPLARGTLAHLLRPCGQSEEADRGFAE